MTQSYWNNTGKYQAALDILTALIPNFGPCESPRSKNKALDKLRRAQNAYYDLFNNGGMNYRGLIENIFNIRLRNYYIYSSGGRRLNFTRLAEILDVVMDEFIVLAAQEQNIPLN